MSQDQLFSEFWTAVNFCNGRCLIKTKLLCWGTWAILIYLCVYEKYLEYRYKLFWFREVAVIDSPLGFKISPVRSSWLGLHYMNKHGLPPVEDTVWRYLVLFIVMHHRLYVWLAQLISFLPWKLEEYLQIPWDPLLREEAYI